MAKEIYDVLIAMGDPPASPGWQQQFDVSGIVRRLDGVTRRERTPVRSAFTVFGLPGNLGF